MRIRETGEFMKHWNALCVWKSFQHKMNHSEWGRWPSRPSLPSLGQSGGWVDGGVGGAGWVRPGWSNEAGRWEPTATVWCPGVGARVIHNTADPPLSFRISGVDVHAAANCLRWAAAVTNSHPERERRRGLHGQRPRTSPCIKRCFFIRSQPPQRWLWKSHESRSSARLRKRARWNSWQQQPGWAVARGELLALVQNTQQKLVRKKLEDKKNYRDKKDKTL